jgi:uncharacterized membrane protein
MQPGKEAYRQTCGPTGAVWLYRRRMESPALVISKTVIEYLARSVEFAAALIIAIAAARATWQSFRLLFSNDAPAEAKVAVRLTLGRWLAVALEFELAADVLNTAVTPTWSDIEKLAAIAALRTALNYFLEKEIRDESKPAQKSAEENLQLVKGSVETNHE